MNISELNFEDIQKLPFNARLGIIKYYVGEGMKEADQELTTTKNKGYFPIKSIMNIARPLLYLYQINIKTELLEDGTLLGTFTNWWGEEKEEIKLHASQALPQKIIKKGSFSDKYISNGEIQQGEFTRLPSMANAPQNLGAIFTYLRRYLLTNMFDLQAVDEIENNTGKDKSGDSGNSGNNSSDKNWLTVGKAVKKDKTKEILKVLHDEFNTLAEAEMKLKEITMFTKDGKDRWCQDFVKLDGYDKWLDNVYETVKSKYYETWCKHYKKDVQTHDTALDEQINGLSITENF